MHGPKKVKGILLLGALLIAAVVLLLFGWLAQEMLEGDTQGVDMHVRTSVHLHATPGLTQLMQLFSFLGSVAVVTTLCLVVVGVSLYFRQKQTAVLVAITMFGVAVLDVALKHAFHRIRPVAFFGVSPDSYSFPSGHAVGSLCFYGILAAILARRAHRRAIKIWIWMAAAVLVGMIGLSRIYLGVHYLSDVIAGYCAAIVWLGAIGCLGRTLRAGETRQPEAGKNI